MAETSQISLSICIVNYDSTLADLCEVIASLQESISRVRDTIPQAEIALYLVDNSDKPNREQNLYSELQKKIVDLNLSVHLVQGHGNIGFGAGHNLVISRLISTYHLILNPDVILDENCLTTGIKYLEDHPQTAIVSPFATGADGHKQYLCKTYPALLTFLVRGFVPGIFKPLFAGRLTRYEMRHLSELEPTTGIPIVSGCFMLCRTELLQQVKGFDNNYFLYFEDFDLSLRLGKIADIAYVPLMRITHSGGHATGKGFRHLLMFLKSAIYFFNSHGWRVFKQQ